MPLYCCASIYLKWAILIISGTLLWACQTSTTEVPEIHPPGYFDGLLIPQAKDELDEALGVAHAWQQDAVLHDVDVVAGWEDRSQPAMLTFDFRSESNAIERLAVVFVKDYTEEDSVFIKTTDMTAANKDFREIKPEDWVLDTNEAFQIAQENGGSEYLEASASGVQINFFLEHQKGIVDGPIVWRISYLRLNGGGNLHIVIHAVTGEVLASDK